MGKQRLGQVIVSDGAKAHLTTREITTALLDHVRGNTGNLDEHADQEPERSALERQVRLSVFPLPEGGRFWIMTDMDENVTTVLLPEEF